MADFKFFEKLTSIFKAQVAETIQGAEKIQGGETVNVNLNIKIGEQTHNYTFPEGIDVAEVLNKIASPEFTPEIERQITLRADEKFRAMMKTAKMIGLDFSLDTQQDIAIASTGISFVEFATTSTTSTTTELPDDEEGED